MQNLTKSTSETINYNERFSWDDYGWNQGQIGFGPYGTCALFSEIFGVRRHHYMMISFFTHLD